MKKALSILLLVVMLLTMLSISAFASGYGDASAYFGVADTLGEIWGYADTGISGEGWTWDAESKVLTLSGAEFSPVSQAGGIMVGDGTKIVLAQGTTSKINAIDSISTNNGIYCVDTAENGYTGTLTIEGSGTLVITCNGSGSGISAKNVIVNGATIQIEVTDNATGISGNLELSSGNVVIGAADTAISGTELTIQGGKLEVESCSEDAISVTNYSQPNGEVVIKVSGEDNAALVAKSSILIQGGKFSAESDDEYTSLLRASNLELKNCDANFVGGIYSCNLITINNANVISTGEIEVTNRDTTDTSLEPLFIKLENVTGASIEVWYNDRGTRYESIVSENGEGIAITAGKSVTPEPTPTPDPDPEPTPTPTPPPTPDDDDDDKKPSKTSSSSNKSGKPDLDYNKGGKVTATTSGKVTITADDGYYIEDVIVNGKSKGAVTKLTGLDKDDEVEVIFAKIVEAPVTPAVPTTVRYSDVANNAWYASAVNNAVTNGWMTGVDATHFAPNTQLSRGMLVTVLHRMAGTPQSAAASFTDVEPGAYYANAVAWAQNQDIVSGVDGKFSPNAAITREQLAVILYRAKNQRAGGQSLTGFADAEKVSAWAADAVSWAVQNGVITGKTGGVLDPTGFVTRAEAAQILTAYSKLP